MSMEIKNCNMTILECHTMLAWSHSNRHVHGSIANGSHNHIIIIVIISNKFFILRSHTCLRDIIVFTLLEVTWNLLWCKEKWQTYFMSQCCYVWLVTWTCNLKKLIWHKLIFVLRFLIIIICRLAENN
jgi:hypothetical protein